MSLLMHDELAALDDAPPARRRRRFAPRDNLGTVIAGLILLGVFLCVAIPGLITPGDPNTIDLTARLLGPGASGHILGTDPLGHDVWRLIVYGARLSILVAIAAVVLSCLIGVTLGLLSGYYGGVLSAIIMRWTDVQLSFPFILLAIQVGVNGQVRRGGRHGERRSGQTARIGAADEQRRLRPPQARRRGHRRAPGHAARAPIQGSSRRRPSRGGRRIRG